MRGENRLGLTSVEANPFGLAVPPGADMPLPVQPRARYSPGEILVRFAGAANDEARTAALQSVGGQVVDVVRGGPRGSAADGVLLRVQIAPGLSVEQAIKALSGQPGVVFAEPNFIYSIASVADDPAYVGGQLWGMYGDQTSPRNGYGSQAGEAWSAGYTGSTKVAVGVVDTGIDYTHPDLYQNIWINQGEIPEALRLSVVDVDEDGLITFRDLNAAINSLATTDHNNNGRIDAGDLLSDSRWENSVDDDSNGYIDDLIGWDFANSDNDPYDDNGHGTHVAGTIAATGADGVGVAGVGWSTQIIALKFLSADGSGTLAGAVQALDYYTNAAKAVPAQRFVATNNSWGGGDYSLSLLEAIAGGAKQDILFVAAAGNGGSDGVGDDNDAQASYPSAYDTTALAGYDAVVAVASITMSGALSSFSNYGRTTVDLGAPGSSIYSTVPGGGYATLSGTSMAVPHVTGAIAVYAAMAGSNAAETKAALLSSAATTASLAGKAVAGRLDAGSLMYTGTTLDDVRKGGDTNDLFRLMQGGDDIAFGGSGADIFYYGAALTATDQNDGGEGKDAVLLQGDYSAGLVLGQNSLVDVEGLLFASGSDIRFGAPGGNSYSYNVTTVDANVPAGGKLTINGSLLLAGENLTFNGSAEKDGTFLIYGGKGVDALTGGEKNDMFFFADGARWSAGDKINGGAGFDGIVLRGVYSGGTKVVFGSNDLISIEAIGLNSVSDFRFDPGLGTFSYDITLSDGNVGETGRLIINGFQLNKDELMIVDGSAVQTGSLNIFGGAGNDVISGGAGADVLRGNAGGDVLKGGAGADTFQEWAPSDSAVANPDQILDFQIGIDRIDLSKIDANSTADGNQAFSFIGANAFSGTGAASAGQLRAHEDQGKWFVEGDVDGDGVADFLIQVTATGPEQLSGTDFIF